MRGGFARQRAKTWEFRSCNLLVQKDGESKPGWNDLEMRLNRLAFHVLVSKGG